MRMKAAQEQPAQTFRNNLKYISSPGKAKVENNTEKQCYRGNTL